MTTLTNLISAIAAKDAEHSDYVKESDQRRAELLRDLRDLRSQLNMREANLDQGLIDMAQQTIFVSGVFDRAGDDRDKARSKARQELASGGGLLWQEYIGTKSYDRWHGQLIRCLYGYSPTHGSPILRIGIVDRLRTERPNRILSESEIEASIYYLTHISDIQNAKAQAAA